ncbi:unnamed protein product [Debaryomyces tyrocola]|nr:unnamed protein product [Debaryomyces tyrocola]
MYITCNHYTHKDFSDHCKVINWGSIIECLTYAFKDYSHARILQQFILSSCDYATFYCANKKYGKAKFEIFGVLILRSLIFQYE